MEKFYEAIGDLFSKLKYPIPEFEYCKETEEYVSVDYISFNDTEYTVVVRKNGTVVYGITDGAEFMEDGVLGQISL